MTKALRILVLLLFALPAFGQSEREQLLAPIAHYPASLRSLVLRAARYPMDIIEAAGWLRANPGLRGDAAVRAAQSKPWDSSVKALLARPDLLLYLDDNLDWTRRLGEAFANTAPQAAYAPSYAPGPPLAYVSPIPYVPPIPYVQPLPYVPVYRPVYYVYRPPVVVTRVVTVPTHRPVHVHHSAPQHGAHHGGRRRS